MSNIEESNIEEIDEIIMLEEIVESDSVSDSLWESETDESSISEFPYEEPYFVELFYNIEDEEEELNYTIEEREEMIISQPKKHYIFTYTTSMEGELLFNTSVTMETFIKYPSSVISRYLQWSSTIYSQDVPIEIGYLYFHTPGDSPYPMTCCVLKTFWIRILQRKWRKIFNERKHILQIRKRLDSLRFRELNGIWPKNCLI
jgi:hypothetical protein